MSFDDFVITKSPTDVVTKKIIGYGYWGDPIYEKDPEPEKTPKYKLDNALEQLAKKHNPNLEIVPAKPNEIQIDYDCEDIPKRFEEVLDILRERFEQGSVQWDKFHSTSGKHWHVVLHLPQNITDQERIVWQALFGSDHIREGLSFMRLLANIPNPVLLFMDKNRVPEESGVLEERPSRRFRELEKPS
jgi:hypothetical protein